MANDAENITADQAQYIQQLKAKWNDLESLMEQLPFVMSMPVRQAVDDQEKRKLKRTIEALRDENARLASENSRLRTDRFAEFKGEDYWIYQGDGSDKLRELVCPVVIRADLLADIVESITGEWGKGWPTE